MQTTMACLLLFVLAAAPFMVDATFTYRVPTTTSCCSSLSRTVQSLQSSVRALGSQTSALSGDLRGLIPTLRAVQLQLAKQQTALNDLAACDCALINDRLNELDLRLDTVERLVATLSMDPPSSTPAPTTTTVTIPTTEPPTTTTTDAPTTTPTTTEPPTTTTTDAPTTTSTTTEPPTTTTTDAPTTTTPTTTEPPTTTTTDAPTTTTTTAEPTTTTVTTTEAPTTTTSTEAPTTTTSPTTTTGPQEGDLRLVNGSSPFEGRLEIFLNGEWGTICQDQWNRADAVVACNQLGLPSNDPIAYRGSLPPMSPFGSGTGTIWLDNLRCRGNELRLIDCRSDSDGVNNCDHSEDVGLLCR